MANIYLDKETITSRLQEQSAQLTKISDQLITKSLEFEKEYQNTKTDNHRNNNALYIKILEQRHPAMLTLEKEFKTLASGPYADTLKLCVATHESPLEKRTCTCTENFYTLLNTLIKNEKQLPIIDNNTNQTPTHLTEALLSKTLKQAAQNIIRGW